MSSTVDLSGIEVVDADRRFIRQARKDVELQAHKMLEQGIEAQVRPQICWRYFRYITNQLWPQNIWLTIVAQNECHKIWACWVRVWPQTANHFRIVHCWFNHQWWIVWSGHQSQATSVISICRYYRQPSCQFEVRCKWFAYDIAITSYFTTVLH